MKDVVVLYEAGRRVPGDRVAIPLDMLTESVPGQIYEIEIQTRGIPDPEKAVNALAAELPKVARGLKVVYARVEDSTIRLQVEGSPFLWALVLANLPAILAAVGVVILGVTVFLVAQHTPSWVLTLGATGLALIAGWYIYTQLIKR